MSTYGDLRRLIEAVEVTARSLNQIRISKLAPVGSMLDVPFTDSDDPAELLRATKRQLLIHPDDWALIAHELGVPRKPSGSAFLHGIPVVTE